jgi:hypothetical protein
MNNSLLFRLAHDVTYTYEMAGQDLADLFSKPFLLAETESSLPSIYDYLRVNPTLSRLLFDELIRRHNAVATSIAISETSGFIPGCCCCGIDPYDPTSYLAEDIGAVESRAIHASDTDYDGTGLVSALKNYRDEIHKKDMPPAVETQTKRNTASVIFESLTTPQTISQEGADYLYATLRRNECVATSLFDFARAGAKLATLLYLDTSKTKSPVVSRVLALFGEDMSSLGRNGGGCCCCCCCCCCGGGC